MFILPKFRLVNFLVLFMATSGCGWWNTAYRDFNIDDGSGAMVDIKQRAVVASTIREKIEENKAGQLTTTTNSQTRVCAEPSPDALSAYAAEIAGKVDVAGKAGAELAAAMQENSSFVGLRTQSIQLLRDSFYRLCEGYMNGALDKLDYDLLMRRNQKYMVALLGIEQLTGTIRAPTVTINTQGGGEVGPSISQIRDELKAIDKKILDKETIIKAKTGEINGLGEGTAKNALNEEVEKLDGEIKILEDDKKTVSKQMENIKGLIARGSAAGVVHTVAVPTQRSDQHLEYVTNAIKEIVLTTIMADDLGQKCIQLLSNNNGVQELKDICKEFIKKRTETVNIYIETEAKIIERIATEIQKPDTSQKKIEAYKGLLENMQKSGGGGGGGGRRENFRGGFYEPFHVITPDERFP
ncbi:MAG TPA: hypothetical protein DD706_05550 [Nitrospiraceae bacterium]|nr:hypothetical protein [Nitrospiraceae bacterium]